MEEGEGCTWAGTCWLVDCADEEPVAPTPAGDGESCGASSAKPLWAMEIRPAISRIFNLGKREGIRASAKWIEILKMAKWAYLKTL